MVRLDSKMVTLWDQNSHPLNGFNGCSSEALRGRIQDHAQRLRFFRKIRQGWSNVGEPGKPRQHTHPKTSWTHVCCLKPRADLQNQHKHPVTLVSCRCLDSEDRKVRQATSFERANVWMWARPLTCQNAKFSNGTTKTRESFCWFCLGMFPTGYVFFLFRLLLVLARNLKSST